MPNNIRNIGPGPYSAEVFASLADSLKKGAVIGYPTETVYGLGCDAGNRKAIERIYRLKGRNYDAPFLMLIHEKDDVQSMTEFISGDVRNLMDAFWPGPLTLIFQVRQNGELFHRGCDRVAVRISSDPVCRMLMDEFNKPLISTSANPSGKPPAHTAMDVYGYFHDDVDVILNGGRRKGSPSTILDVSREPYRLIRQGSINRAMLERTLRRRIDEKTV